MGALCSSTPCRGRAGRCSTAAVRSRRPAGVPAEQSPPRARLPSLLPRATAAAASAPAGPRRAEPRASSASRGRCCRSSPGCRRRARGSHPWRRASGASPERPSRSASGPEAVRARTESPPRRSAPAPASPPSAPLGPAPSGCPAAASSRPPSGCTGARPLSAGTALRAAPWRSPRGTDRRRSCSTSASVWASTPAEPLFRLTRFHASHRTSLRWMRSYSAWKRRPGDRLAATTAGVGVVALCPQAQARGGGWVRACRPCPRAYLLRCHDHRRDPSLRPRCSSRPSPVLRSPRTPAAQRPISPSAYTGRLAATTAAQTGLSCSAPILARVLRPVPRRDPPRFLLRTSARVDVAFAVT